MGKRVSSGRPWPCELDSPSDGRLVGLVVIRRPPREWQTRGSIPA